MSSEAELRWEGLALWRGDACLQTGLAGLLAAGQALTLRGPNGCGKTTLLRTLCGLSEPESGAVFWRGNSLHSQTGRTALHADLAYAGHQTGLKGELSTRENCAFAAALEGGNATSEELLAALGLQHCADLPVRSLSAGQKRRAALARVLGSGRRLWVLDEPFSNLDPAGRDWLSAQLRSHLGSGGLLLLAAHQDTAIGAGERILNLAAPRQVRAA